jgi:hypothetical protein
VSMGTVRSAAETIVKETLGQPYRELPFQFEIDRNDERAKQAGYAVVWGAASQNYSVHQTIMMEQDLIVKVVKRVFVRNTDNKITDRLDDVYGLIADLIPRFVEDRLDIPETVTEGTLSAMSEPQFFGENRDVVSLTLTFRMTYKLS